MDRTIIYTRVSSNKQDDNYSTGQQVQACTEFAKAQKWEIYQHLHDTQSGADFFSREYLQKCIELIRLGQAQTVTFSVVDRIGRSYQVFENLTKEIYKAGGKIAVASKNKVFKSYDDFWEGCEDDISESSKERRRIKKRTTTARMKAFLEGSYMKRPPYGYVVSTVIRKLEGRKEKFNALEVVIPQAKSINTILEKYLETRSFSATAKYANEAELYHSTEMTGEVKTFWHYSTIVTIIDNAELYAGIPRQIKYRDTPFRIDKETGELKITEDNPEITYTYPEIISKELAENVRIIRNQAQNRVNKSANPRPFVGLVRCKCGKKASYQATTTVINSQYLCISKAQNKHSKNIGGRLYHKEVCKHSISPRYFILKLKEYLESLDTDSFITSAELAISEVIDSYTGFAYTLGKIEEKKAELSKLKSNIIRNSSRLDPDEDSETLRAYSEEVKLIQIEIDELAEEYRSKEKQKAKFEKMFTSLGIEWQEKESILSLSSGEFEGFSKIVPTMDKVREYLESLKLALAGEDWDKVSDLMTRLGLSFEADFSIAGKLARRDSIRIKFTLEDDLEDIDPPKGSNGSEGEEASGEADMLNSGFSGTTTSSARRFITWNTPCATWGRWGCTAPRRRTGPPQWSATRPRLDWATPSACLNCTAPLGWNSALTASMCVG